MSIEMVLILNEIGTFSIIVPILFIILYCIKHPSKIIKLDMYVVIGFLYFFSLIQMALRIMMEKGIHNDWLIKLTIPVHGAVLLFLLLTWIKDATGFGSNKISLIIGVCFFSIIYLIQEVFPVKGFPWHLIVFEGSTLLLPAFAAFFFTGLKFGLESRMIISLGMVFYTVSTGFSFLLYPVNSLDVMGSLGVINSITYLFYSWGIYFGK